MITKKATINLTQEEIDSPEDIQIVLTVNGPGGEGYGIINTILFPKDKPKSLPPLEDLLNAGR